MAYFKPSRNRQSFYLIPIVVGMAGLLFSRQLDSLALRSLVVLVSVAVPLFVAGFTLARLYTRNWERWMLLVGVLLLMVGAMVSVSGLSESLVEREMMSERVGALSLNLGMGSLVVGLVFTLFAAVQSGRAFEELGERFHSLAEHMGEGLVLTSKEGEVVLVNPTFLRMTGLTEEEIVGQRAMELIRDLGAQPMDEHLGHRAQGVSSEYEVLWSVDGKERTFWVSGAPIFDNRNHHTGTLATMRDITEMREMSQRLEKYTRGLQTLVEDQTQRLRESEEHTRDLLENMSEGFLTVNSEFKVQFANDRLRELLRASEELIQERDVFDFFDAAQRSRLRDLFDGAAHSPHSRVHDEFNCCRTDGSLIPVVVAIAPVEGSPSDELHYSLVVTDVSALKRLQHELELRAEQLQKMNEELRAHDRAKDVFLTNVSHELKTPLSTLRGYVEMMTSGSLGEVDAPQSGALGVMIRNIERLEDMIVEMIDFSRMEIQGIRLDWTLFPLNKLILERTRSVEPQVVAKSISLSVNMSDDFPPVWGDKGKLGQVLGILLSNAAKFTPEGGSIHVRAECPDEGVSFSVSDTGIGIPESSQEQIFAKFFQVDSSHTRRHGGTGIGLSIAKNIVEAHGGAIVVESAPGAGSTFTVLLPRGRFGGEVDTPDLRGMKISLGSVDDEFRILLRTFLEQWGAEVECHSGGYECARHAASWEPDGILLDDVMTDISGLETLSQLRREEALATAWTLLMLRSDEQNISQEGPLPDGVHILTKPFTLDQFARTLPVHHVGATADSAPPLHTQPDTRGMLRPQMMVVCADSDLLDWIRTVLEHRKIDCVSAGDLSAALEIIKKSAPDLILADLDGVDGPAGESFARFRGNDLVKGLPFYTMTGDSKQNTAQRDMDGTLYKPFAADALQEIIQRSVAPRV